MPGSKSLVPMLSLLLLTGGTARAAPQPDGAEFQVNSFTENNQIFPAVDRGPSGQHVIVWESIGEDGSGRGVYARRFDPEGDPIGDPFRVNVTTTDDQFRPDVAVDAAGGFVVVWNSFGQDGSGMGVIGRRYDGEGTPLGGEFQVNTHTLDWQYYPVVGMDDGGAFVVVWNSFDQDGEATGVYGQRYDASGAPLGGEFRANTQTLDLQFAPAISVEPDGRFVVVWQSFGQDGSGTGIYGQIFGSDGAQVGGEFRVNSTTEDWQYYPSVASAQNGEFVVVWQSFGQDGSSTGVFGKRFDASGGVLADEFAVNVHTPSSQSNPKVAMSPSGEFLVAWQSFAQDGSGSGVFARRYDAAGVDHDGEFQVNTQTYLSQGYPDVGIDVNGNLVLVWESYGQDGSAGGIFGRRFVGACVPGPVADLMIVPDGSGFLMTWTDTVNAEEYVVFEDTLPSGDFVQETGTSPGGAIGLTLSGEPETRHYLVAGRNLACGAGPLR